MHSSQTSLRNCDTQVLEVHGAEKVNTPPELLSAGPAVDGAGTASKSFSMSFNVNVKGIFAPFSALGHAVADGAAMISRNFTLSSAKVAEIEARRDTIKYALDKQLEIRKEQHRHELEMMKSKGVQCRFNDCGVLCDDDLALTKHFQEFHCGVKCHMEGCEAFLETSDAVEKHIQLFHTGVKCHIEGCEAFLGSNDAVVKHIQLFHTGAVFACQEEGCEALFNNTNDLCRHTSECH